MVSSECQVLSNRHPMNCQKKRGSVIWGNSPDDSLPEAYG
jgi:hypothetical protein